MLTVSPLALASKTVSKMKIDPAQLGSAIRELRQMRKLTQEQVADQLGITVNYLSLLENGKRGVNTPNLNKLAAILKVSPAIIMTLGTSCDPREDNASARLTRQFQKLIRTTMEAQAGLS
jgi:transcriptional regulator with XRE-family HTH domain